MFVQGSAMSIHPEGSGDWTGDPPGGGCETAHAYKRSTSMERNRVLEAECPDTGIRNGTRALKGD